MNDSETDSESISAARRSVLRGIGAAGLSATIGLSTVSGAVRSSTVSDEATSEDATEIEDWNDLDAVRTNLSDEYVLMNSLDADTAGYDAVAGPDANGGNGFAPIGEWGHDAVAFTGTFDGQGNEIRDLVIDRPDEVNVGLFGVVEESAVISEVELVGVDITGDERVGGLIGWGYDGGGDVVNSSVSGDITGGDLVGGLIADNQGGDVVESSADGIVTGGNRVGGLVGEHSTGTVVDSSASVDVTGLSGVGGLVGFNLGEISASAADGDVSGDVVVGGLVGAQNGELLDAEASGAVAGEEHVGGLVGELFDGTVDQSSASGAVTGEGNVGGLVGRSSGEVVESMASGSVTASGEFGTAGGLVGFHPDGGAVSRSAASGDVTASSVAGGLVGNNRGGRVVDTVAIGDVDGTDHTGGLIGRLLTGTVAESYARGDVAGSGVHVGIVGLLGASANGPDDEAVFRDSYWRAQDGLQRAFGERERGDGTAQVRGEVTELDAAVMQGEAAEQHLSALDFEETWTVPTDPPGYPTLRTLPFDTTRPADERAQAATEQAATDDETTDTAQTNSTDPEHADDDSTVGQPEEDDTVPGFGIAGTVTAVLGGYLFARRDKDDSRE